MSWSKLSGHLHNAQGVLNARLHLKTAELRGPGVRLWGRPEIRNEGTLIVGDRTRFISTVATLELAVGPGGMLDIGERCFINYGTSIAATRLVRIGAHCNIGTHVLMMDNDFHRLEPERRNEMPESAPIILEDNVWLG
ncbi:MAG TPA: hypothetical protein VFQ61_03875, partial [Polyangiaceae bacterium]|nr:hypothetical protein [Polyangiaceae bacterium]